jgi:hypothetical protein
VKRDYYEAIAKHDPETDPATQNAITEHTVGKNAKSSGQLYKRTGMHFRSGWTSQPLLKPVFRPFL